MIPPIKQNIPQGQRDDGEEGDDSGQGDVDPSGSLLCEIDSSGHLSKQCKHCGVVELRIQYYQDLKKKWKERGEEMKMLMNKISSCEQDGANEEDIAKMLHAFRQLLLHWLMIKLVLSSKVCPLNITPSSLVEKLTAYMDANCRLSTLKEKSEELDGKVPHTLMKRKDPQTRQDVMSVGVLSGVVCRLFKMSEYGKFGPLVGAIDEGTSSARFIIFKANSCEVVAVHQKELEQCFPQEGWVEQDPNAILEVVVTCISKAVEKLVAIGGNPKDIIAVGVTNQRETTIVWDKNTGKPLHNAIVWLDMRTSSTIDKLLDLVPNKTRNKNYLKPLCGLPMSPYFSAVKLRWLSDNVDAVKQAMKSGSCFFGTVDTWIIWNLTGGVNGGKHVTDVTNASRTMLMNIENLTWDPLLMKFFEVPKSVLPEIKSSSEIYGHISDGPLRGIPISGCLGDQQAALVGQMCLQQGQAKATYGTGCFVLYNTGDIRVNSTRGLLTTVAYQLGNKNPPCYALEGSVAIAGAALGWLRDNIGLLESVSDSQQIAEKAMENGSVVFVPAFSGLYAPYWRQDARGVICGITEDTNSNHIVKAALEAVCFQVRDILDAMNEDCGIPLQLLKVDGGMTSNALVMQMQSDLIGINVIKAGFTESTALGAALVAYWGLDGNRAASQIAMSAGSTYTPKINDDERDMRYKQWKMAVERSLGWEQN